VAALGLNRVHQTQMLFLESREPTEGGHGGVDYQGILYTLLSTDPLHFFSPLATPGSCWQKHRGASAGANLDFTHGHVAESH